jgi:hypothetical protein
MEEVSLLLGNVALRVNGERRWAYSESGKSSIVTDSIIRRALLVVCRIQGGVVEYLSYDLSPPNDKEQDK